MWLLTEEGSVSLKLNITSLSWKHTEITSDFGILDNDDTMS